MKYFFNKKINFICSSQRVTFFLLDRYECFENKKLDENAGSPKCLYFPNGQNITTATAKNIMYINTIQYNTIQYNTMQ